MKKPRTKKILQVIIKRRMEGIKEPGPIPPTIEPKILPSAYAEGITPQPTVRSRSKGASYMNSWRLGV